MGKFRYGIAGLLAALLAAAPLLLAIGALRDPTSSLHGMLGSALWTTLGPHFVLVSLVALGMSIYAGRGGSRRIALLALTLAAGASIASVTITGRIIAATNAAGGHANPFSGLFLRSMTAGAPDETVTVATVDGRPLRAAIYRPRLPGPRRQSFSTCTGAVS